MREHIIYTDWMDFDEYKEDIFDFFIENGYEEEEITENMMWDEFYEMQETYFENERYNLDVKLPSEIIAFANVGRWNGRHNGYKVLGNNLNEIFNYGEDYNEWKVDQYGRVEQRATHHDGTNYVEYRLLKPTLTDEQKENFFDRLDYEGMDEKTMRRYTVRLGDVIGDVYGWKFCGTRPNGI